MTEYNITCVCVMTWQSEHLGGPGHTSGGAFLPAKILSKAIDFERPGGREWLPSGTPFQKFYTFFGRFFGRACLRPRYVKSLRSGFFGNVKKVCSKGHIGYAAWGLPQGPAFACTLTLSNKTKKTQGFLDARVYRFLKQTPSGVFFFAT